MKPKIKLKTKLLFVFVVIIVFNTVAIMFLGNNYIESFYKYRKSQEIVRIAEDIIRLKDEHPNERRPWYSYVVNAESKYYDFLIFDYNDMRPSVLYYTKSSVSSENSKSYQYWINEAISNNVFVSFNIFQERIMTQEYKEKLQAYVRLEENQYLFISTPLEYIATTSQLAIEFYTYISLISMVIAFIFIALLADRFTKPIVKLTKITFKISNMQFDEKCEVKGNDEISELAQNINNMSDKIEENMNLLIENNEVLKRDLDRQEKSEQLRRQFVSNVSHDFKTPLALIQAYSEVLEETCDKENKETLDIIISQTKQMNILVNELLSLNQLESGLIELEKSFFAIDEIITDVLTSLAILINDKHLQYTYTKDNDYIVEGDYQRIHQVIQNLIENAVKYTPENETFTIDISKHYSRIEIDISNIAPKDMDEETMSHLFDSFYMADKTRNATLKSYGLGLAIVKATMDLHEQNCGARLENGYITFFITLDIYNLLDDEDEDEHEITVTLEE